MNLIESLHQPLTWLLGQPKSTAVFRFLPEDFHVTEILGFEPDGEGEHVFALIRKTGENTDWVAQQLARHTKTHPKDIGYAGKKDRHAVTEQWFSVKIPIKQAVDWSGFESDTIQVIRHARHSRKLKTGVHQGNRFVIRLRKVTDGDDLQQRFEQLMRKGVPNYFGEQRFGHDFGNLYKGYRMLLGELRENNRQKRGLYISALRSMLFNRVVSARIDQGLWDKLALGDVLMLNASQSCFNYIDPEDAEGLALRLKEKDLHHTAPLWGRGGLMTRLQALAFEEEVLLPWQEICSGLESLGLNQERRAARVLLDNAFLEKESSDEWTIGFDLPAGAFATSVLRELSHLHTEDAA